MKAFLSGMVLAVVCTSTATAQVFDGLYVGGGGSVNSLDNFRDAGGYQVFAGYDVGLKLGGFSTAVELGYMDSGKYKLKTTIPGLAPTTVVNGAWVSGVASYPVTDYMGVLGRVGYDFGDDNGPLVGVGVSSGLSKPLVVRGEYVSRKETRSIQINIIYGF